MDQDQNTLIWSDTPPKVRAPLPCVALLPWYGDREPLHVRANALLIAAVGDLLAACQAALLATAFDDFRGAAFAAIAKATGVSEAVLRECPIKAIPEATGIPYHER